MKTRKLVTVTLAFAALAASCAICVVLGRITPSPTPGPTRAPTRTTTPPTPSSMPLPSLDIAEAIERGDVQVEICGARRVAGPSMVMTITRLATDPLQVIVPPGTVLHTSKQAYQDMLVTEEVRVSLTDDAPQKVDLVAYCIDAAKHAPTDEVLYSVETLEDPELWQLAAALPDMEHEDYLRQAPLLGAIWSLTDDITITQIQSRLMFGYAAIDLVRAKMILERAGIDASSRRLFAPQEAAEVATWHYGMGEYLYRVEQDLDQAIAEYTKAIESEPRSSIYQKRAFVYEHKEEYAKAVADLDKAIELEPSSVFYKSKAEIHIEMGEYDRAIADYGEAIELASDESRAASLCQDRAELCMEQGDYAQAIADYTRCIEFEPDGASRYHDRARAYMENGDYEAAVADYTKAIELKPDWDLSYWCRGKAYQALGETGKAIADFETVVAAGGSWASSAERRLDELRGEGQ